MEFGAHLPLLSLDGRPPALAHVCAYARQAAAAGFRFLCANDHLLYNRPWLDGPTVLAAALEAAGDMTLATTVALPVVRGPVQTAKLLGSLDVLCDGRLVAGVGPGSSARDYAAVGIPFEERWPRFEEAVLALRALLSGAPYSGRFYTATGVELEPRRSQPPPLWIGSWGSPAGLRRVARLGDGWLASAYNTTPDGFREHAGALAHRLGAAGRDPTAFPHALATTWMYVTDHAQETRRVLAEVLAPLVKRPLADVEALTLPVGTPEQCAEAIAAYAEAGVRRLFVWPLGDDLRQLDIFRESVVPLVAAAEPG